MLDWPETISVPWEARARLIQHGRGNAGNWEPLHDALLRYKHWSEEDRSQIARLQCKSLLPLPNGQSRTHAIGAEIDFLVRALLD